MLAFRSISRYLRHIIFTYMSIQNFTRVLLCFSIFIILIPLWSSAQAPYKFNYQGIARDVTGNPMNNQSISIDLFILNDANASKAEFEEVHQLQTNEFGLYQLQIGNGTVRHGSMEQVKWEQGNKFIKVAIDPAGGEHFLPAGTTQLLSVPYAIYAERAGTSLETKKTRSGTMNYLSKFDASGSSSQEVNSQVYDNGTSIGIGTMFPFYGAKLHLLSNNSQNELLRLQNLDSLGIGRFTMFNDVDNKYATFTKYGSIYPGGYPGIETQYPFANMLAFGNNGGPFLLSTSGNIGMSLYKNNFSKLKININYETENVGIGGSAIPATQVHFNQSSIGDTVKLTNAYTGHTISDGFDIYNYNDTAYLMNRENASLQLGANNKVGLKVTNAGAVQIPGDLFILSGNPANGKVLTSDGSGQAAWVDWDTTNQMANWSTLGNSGLSPIQYLGTTDSQSLKFKVNNQLVGVFAVSGNLAFGKSALLNSTTGVDNIAIGREALKNNQTQSYNVAIGPTAMRDMTSGNSNVSVGAAATQAINLFNSISIGNAAGAYQQNLFNNVLIGNNTGVPKLSSGYSNTFLRNNVIIGDYALNSIGKAVPDSQVNDVAVGVYALANSNSSDNIGIGAYAGQNLQNNYNIAIGTEALHGGVTGTANLAIGWRALRIGTAIQSSISIGHNTNVATVSGTGNTTLGVAAAGNKISGDRNCFVGWHSGINNLTGNDNVFVGVHIGAYNQNTSNASTMVGSYSGYNLTSGTENTTLGFETLNNTTTGSDNIAIGFQAGKFMTSQSNVIAIGYKAGINNTQSNRVIIGYNELPRFPDAASAAAALPSSGPNGVYIYWNTTTNQIMVNP